MACKTEHIYSLVLYRKKKFADPCFRRLTQPDLERKDQRALSIKRTLAELGRCARWGHEGRNSFLGAGDKFYYNNPLRPKEIRSGQVISRQHIRLGSLRRCGFCSWLCITTNHAFLLLEYQVPRLQDGDAGARVRNLHALCTRCMCSSQQRSSFPLFLLL